MTADLATADGFNMKELMWNFHTLFGAGCDSGIFDECLELRILVSSH